MKLITDFFRHPFLYGLLAIIGLAIILPALGLIIIPFHVVISNLNESRCPKCRGFFKRKLVDWEIADEREVLKTVNRVDQGTIYSNSLFEPNRNIEINRQEQVTFVEQTIRNHWACKDSICGHKWETDEIRDWEGSLD